MKDRKHRIYGYFLSLMLLVCALLPAFSVRAEEPAATVTFTNAPDEKPYLEIRKEILAEEDVEIPEETFHFIVKIKNGTAYQTYANQEYTLYDANGETIPDTANSNPLWNTGANGMVALKAGQTAKFDYVGVNKEYQIEEIGLAEQFQCETPAGGKAVGTIGARGATVLFQNRYTPVPDAKDGALTVQKKVSYPQGYRYEGAESFGFTLLVDKKAAKSESYNVKSLETGAVVPGGKTDENGHFTLKAGEAAVFAELEAGVDYKVTEDPCQTGWRSVGENTFEGSTSDHATVTFTNTNASFTVTKKLAGEADEETEFTFQLLNGEMQTWADAPYMLYTTAGVRADEEDYRTDANGCFKLKANQAAIFTGIGPGTAYSVKEQAPGELGYSQQTPADVAGYVGKSVTASGTEILPFVNEKLEQLGSLTVTKKLSYQTEGEAPLAGAEREFRFRISRIDGGNSGEKPGTEGELPETAPDTGTKNTADPQILAGASYTIGADTRQYKTDENGEFTLREGQTAVFADLFLDKTYRVEEIGLADNQMPGYAIDEAMQTQEGILADDGALQFTFNNTYTARHFDLKLYKVDDSKESEKALQDAKFMLYTDEALTVAYKPEPLVTGEDGTATLPDMREGTYYLKEVAAPKGYRVMEHPVKITVTRRLEEGREILDIDMEQQADEVISAQMKQTAAANPSLASDTLEITVKNDRGRLYSLPATGGPGFGGLVGFGILFMAAAVVLALRSRKKTA